MAHCKKHPRYKAIRVPRTPCYDCWTVYVEENITGVDWDRTGNEEHDFAVHLLVEGIINMVGERK